MIRRGARLGWPIVLLVIASVIGTAGMMAAGGKPALLSVMAAIETNRPLVIIAFAVWALAANCLVLPAGSLSLMAGGAVLGTLVPAAIWFAAQLVTAPVVYRVAGNRGSGRGEVLVWHYLGAAAAATVSRAAEAGITTTILLRLTPVLPSAPAALIASWAGIDLRSFLIGSVLGGWVRPVYFASLGTAAGALATMADNSEALSLAALTPLGLTFGCAALALYLRLRLSRQPVLTAPSRAPPG